MTKIVFTLPASNIIGAAECVLLGEFNNWNMDEAVCLQKQADGSMTAELELQAGRDYEYRYLLSNGRWVNDNNEKVVSETPGFPVENCLVRVLEIVEEQGSAKPKTANPKTGKTIKVSIAKPVVVKEDLTKIEGIGKKIEALLNKNKIYSYKQLAKTTIKTLKEILEMGGSNFGMHNPGSWPKQAKLAANTKWEELEELQQQLKGGK